MGGAVSTGEDNEELVDNLVEAEYVKTAIVERALRAVDRGNYYLDEFRENAYKDLAWKHGNLHLSAPCIYSEVLECLHLRPGMSFLNLGSGTGYLSTIAGLLLGSHGINHGVELHEDVVKYAKEKFDSFVQNSPAIDLMDFCAPKFVAGNCLQLDPACSIQSYDRVYCGAAVPPEHVGFIKSLIKIGGVLVIPCDDQLLHIKRTGVNSWDQKRVLPVSFASLIVPTREQLKIADTVSLPSREPLSLIEICRSATRSVLRQRIIESNPDNEMRSLVIIKSKDGALRTTSEGNEDYRYSRNANARRRQRRLRRIVIPVFQTESDEEEDEQPGVERAQRGGARRHVIAFGAADVYRNRAGRIQMNDLRWNRFFVDGGANRSQRTVRQTDHDNEEQGEKVNDGDGEHSSNSSANGDMDSELLKDTLAKDQQELLQVDDDNFDIAKGGDISDKQQYASSCSDDKHPPTTDDAAQSLAELHMMEASNDNKNNETAANSSSDGQESLLALAYDDPSQRGPDENIRDVTTQDAAAAAADASKRGLSDSDGAEGETRRKRAASFPWRNNGCHGDDGDDNSDAEDEANAIYKEEQRKLRDKNKEMLLRFSSDMKKNIFLLPLPDSLKNYLNYYRN